MLGRNPLLRTGSFRPENLGQNALAMITNLCFAIFVVGVLIFTIIAATYEPEDPLFHPSTQITTFLTSTSNATFKSDNTVVKTGEDFMAANQTAFATFINITDVDNDVPATASIECEVDKPIDCTDQEIFHVMMKAAIEHFKDIHFYRFGKAVAGLNDSSCHMAWRFRPKEGKTAAFYKDYRSFVISRSENCTLSVIGIGGYHSGGNARKKKKNQKPGFEKKPKKQDLNPVSLPEVGEIVNDTLPVVESEGSFSRGRYLIYVGSGDRCKPMNHYLWSFMCALGEAQYLNRTLIMDLSICLSSIYTSSHQDEESKDFRFYFDFEHLKESASVLDQAQFWTDWNKWNQKDGLNLHLVEDFRVTPMKLSEVKDTLIMRKFGSVEPDNYWYRVCEGETESVVQRPWHLVWKSKRLMDIVSAIASRLNWDFDSINIVRGEKARNKELWPRLDADTSPEALISTLRDKIEDGRNLYIAHKSHKQSKHSSREAREHSDSEEDVKTKDRSGKEEESVRVYRDSGLSEKRKLSLGKDLSGHGNGDTVEEYGSSKRRKEKADASAGSDRWNGGGDERGDGGIVEKETKGESSRIDGEKSSKSTTLIDLKSKSSKRHDGGSEKKEEKGGLVSEKEESKSSSRVDSKRKSEKDSGRKEVKDSKESKEKERGLEREKKIQEIKRETEAVAVGDEASRKQGSHLVDFGEERQGKRGRENTEWPIQDELRNPELEKELEKRIRRRRDGSNDKDKYEDDVKESEDRRLSLRGERAKDSRYKDEKRKDGSSGDKHREDGDRDNRNREDKYREDAERDSRHRDVKHREDGDGDNRHRDEKYHEDGERDNRHREDKYREDGDRDNRQRDNKYREDGDRDNRHRGDKYREDGDRDDRHRDDKYREDGDRDDRHRDDWYAEDGNRDSRNREEKNGEDIGRDGRRRDGKQRDDSDKDKRFRDAKYRDERSSRDRTSDKSDIKRLRDESNAAELHYRKSNNRDGSPIYDDRGTRYKDDKGRRRTSDKEDHGDIRSRSTKEQHSDAGKKSISSARVESVSDRGRSNARNADVDITPNHSRRRNSPSSSSHAAKDHYRLSKQEESKYRDYAHEERVRHNVTSSKEFSGVAGGTEKASLSRSIEKSLQKDDSHLGELSADRRPKADARTSPLHVVDKSPSSTSTDRRHWNRSNIRRNLDVEDSGQKSGGSKDARDYSAREGRGSRDVPMETLPGDELSQADGDNFSVSSPFSRTSHLSSNSRSLLPPPPPFRMGADSPVAFGSLEDDNRGKSNNRHRRIGDPNMGRVQGSPWRGIPNWPSPMANGFMPFQHGPPPVGFHPVMQQFRTPPMFGVRSSMELNQSGVPYHVPDGDRFSGHGRSLSWRNPVDDSCPPIHGWDGSSAIFGDESHMYGRLDWNHNRSLTGGRVWETSGDAWKGQNSGASTELPSAPQKEDCSARGPADDVWAGQSGLQAQNDKKQPSVLVESVDIDQSSDARERDTVETSKTILEEMPNLSRKDDSCLSQVYLSMLDISADLTDPELYSQYTSLMGMDQNSNSEEDDSKILFVEEAMDATVKLPEKTSSVSLFPTINDAVFQKAMSLYKKLREDVKAINVDKVPFSNVKNLESAPTLDQEVAGLDDDKQGEVVPACDQQEAEAAVSVLNDVKMEEVSPATTCEKIDEPVLVDSLEKSESSIAALNEENLELDLVSKQETLDSIVEDKSSDPENVELFEANSPSKVKEVSRAIGSNDDGPKLPDTKCGPSLFSDVSSEACEAVMPESIESTMVNLSRIHQSPESTH